MPEQFHYNPPGSIFVFGSNLAGIHGAGAARTAMETYGAKLRQGVGRQGSSYAIPTKDAGLYTLPLDDIKIHVDQFLAYARTNGKETFYVTKIGCGLAGYTDSDISPMFKNAPDNCLLPDGWR